MPYALEDAPLLYQIWQGTAAIAVDQRRNAQRHLQLLDALAPEDEAGRAKIAAMMADCSETYLAISAKLAAARADATLGTQIAATLTRSGVTGAALDADRANVESVAQALRDADKRTITAMRAACNAVLAAAPAHKSVPYIWDGPLRGELKR